MDQVNTREQQDYSSIVTSSEKTSYVQRMFARIAPRYDFLNHVMSLGLDIGWRRKAVKLAKFPNSARIIDLGAGTGDFAREVIKQHPDCHMIGLDNCQELMHIGQHKHGLESMDWLLAHGQKLPIADSSVDGVIAGFSIRNMANVPNVFQEINRVIRPGGVFVILEMVRPTNLISYKIFYYHFKYIVPRLGRLLGSDPDAYEYLLPSIEHFYSTEKIKSTLLEQKFGRVWFRRYMFQSVALCVGTKA
ncbi:ubiquinone/menaquinone biosynthesis methyltransferase [candidate division KSB1 bacterium]|nr:ubiquinone/menaquinone biosynthesis methyltransferase [candidate division KSB1 bacterium]